MSETTERLDAIEARHDAWYSGDDAHAEWPDELSFVESYEHDRDSTPRQRAMAHEITREDVPYLLTLARKQAAALEAVKVIEQRLERSMQGEDREIAEDLRAALEATP